MNAVPQATLFDHPLPDPTRDIAGALHRGAGEVIDQARREETQALVRAAEGRRATVDEDVGMQVCPDCGSKHKTPRGLKHHRTVMHGPHKPASPKSKDPRPTGAPRLLLVREGRLTLSLGEILALHPEFSLAGHHFRIAVEVANGGGIDCEILD